MNIIGLLFFLVSAAALLAVPRRWAPVPLLAGCCYLTYGQGVNLGPISLPPVRMLLAVGLLRILVRGERMAGKVNTIDGLMIAFGTWIMIASFFHDGVDAGPLTSAGVVFSIGLVYYLFRVFCRTTDELEGLIKVISFLLILVAAEMVQEKVTARNMFSKAFGGVSETVVMRNDRLRARGPFRHAILAGTVGATFFPLAFGIRRRHPKTATIGMATSLVMVYTSASSGPIMSLIFSCAGLAMWRYRHYCRYIPIAAVVAYLGLELAMTRPAYYIISKIDLAGGSTAWHRSHLIDSSIEYIADWWLTGTDYTRHWMASGVTFSKSHTDITNYYLNFGVQAGLPAMLLLIAMLWLAFRWVGSAIREPAHLLNDQDRWLIWCLSAGMVGHAATSVSVAYYDQSFLFFWFNLAVISSFHSVLATAAASTQPAATATATEAPPRPVGPEAPCPAQGALGWR